MASLALEKLRQWLVGTNYCICHVARENQNTASFFWVKIVVNGGLRLINFYTVF